MPMKLLMPALCPLAKSYTQLIDHTQEAVYGISGAHASTDWP